MRRGRKWRSLLSVGRRHTQRLRSNLIFRHGAAVIVYLAEVIGQMSNEVNEHQVQGKLHAAHFFGKRAGEV